VSRGFERSPVSSTLPLVTVVIPARNEERHIEACVGRIAAQDYPLGRIEVLLIDGASTDRTVELAVRALEGVDFARAAVIPNQVGTTPSNLNRGLAEASGQYLCRVDARSFIPPHYVRTCVLLLQSRPEFAVVGGAQVAESSPGAGVVGRGIARALSSPHATGLARYRRRRTAGPGDTVYLGVFRTADVRDEGGWDERFLTNQDYELNRRMAKRGLVWFEAGVEVGYRPRETLGALLAQYRRFGRWKAAAWLETPMRPAGRQIILLSFPILGPVIAAQLLRRWGWRVPVAGASAALLAGGVVPGRSDLRERLVGLCAAVLVPVAWLTGILEQTMRWSAGERLLRRR